MTNQDEVIKMNTKTRKNQQNIPDEELRNHLCAQIEVEWNKNQNADLVDDLAFQHPELATELYEFFALLVQMELEDEEDENGGAEDAADERLAEWLRKEGFDIALRAGAEACHTDSTSPTYSSPAQPARVQDGAAKCGAADSAAPDNLITHATFLRAAQKREKMKAGQISVEIKTPLKIITIAEENPDPQFDPLRDEISDRYARRFGRDKNQVRESFGQVAWAAKTGKTTLTQNSIETAVKKLNLPKAEQNYWLTLMGLKK